MTQFAICISSQQSFKLIVKCKRIITFQKLLQHISIIFFIQFGNAEERYERVHSFTHNLINQMVCDIKVLDRNYLIIFLRYKFVFRLVDMNKISSIHKVGIITKEFLQKKMNTSEVNQIAVIKYLQTVRCKIKRNIITLVLK